MSRGGERGERKEKGEDEDNKVKKRGGMREEEKDARDKKIREKKRNEKNIPRPPPAAFFGVLFAFRFLRVLTTSIVLH